MKVLKWILQNHHGGTHSLAPLQLVVVVAWVVGYWEEQEENRTGLLVDLVSEISTGAHLKILNPVRVQGQVGHPV
jgi:hypothetical protein